MIPRGRIRKSGHAPGPSVQKLGVDRGDEAQFHSRLFGRVISQSEQRALARCRHLLRQAEAEADKLLKEARLEAERRTQREIEDARANEMARLAVHFLELRGDEEHRVERARQRILEVAMVLAERILGTAIREDPAALESLARTVLAEARGAREIEMAVHPEDAQHLSKRVSALGILHGTLTIISDPSLSRGDIEIRTDIGRVQAPLRLQLERLVAAIRDVV